MLQSTSAMQLNFDFKRLVIPQSQLSKRDFPEELQKSFLVFEVFVKRKLDTTKHYLGLVYLSPSGKWCYLDSVESLFSCPLVAAKHMLERMLGAGKLDEVDELVTSK
ncbi:MAG: hypothetical protein ACFBSE_02705, partial [Prochloraceae cyanobacterium]